MISTIAVTTQLRRMQVYEHSNDRIKKKCKKGQTWRSIAVIPTIYLWPTAALEVTTNQHKGYV